jgi:threonine dehydrogenase-like Zn-dependent dehydrogenase
VNPPPDARGHGGGFAEYLVAPSSSLLPVPDGLDHRAAALAEPFGVALRGIDLAGANHGDVAYVQGLGPIGLLVVAGLTAAGCRVVGSDPRADRRALALELGAQEVFDPTARDPHQLLSALEPKGPGLAFECSGVPEALQQVFDACGPGGVVGILGIPMAPAFLLRMTLKELRAFSIQGPTLGSMRRALASLLERPAVARVATHSVPLAGAADAFEALTNGRGGAKVLVAPER